jgi:hypothetical protein
LKNQSLFDKKIIGQEQKGVKKWLFLQPQQGHICFAAFGGLDYVVNEVGAIAVACAIYGECPLRDGLFGLKSASAFSAAFGAGVAYRRTFNPQYDAAHFSA